MVKMRFYAEVEDWKQENLYAIIQEPWYVFATDLLYFMACEYGTGWVPYKVQIKYNGTIIPRSRHIYTPHPQSPFTNNMRRAVKYGILPSDPVFEETYQMILREPGVRENKLARFIDHVQEAFDEFFSAERNMRDMLMVLLYVGKMATIFHMQGTKDAPQFALTLMAQAILRLGSKVPLHTAFEGMDSFAIICVLAYHKAKDEEEKRKNS